jgi:hypothetical protein
LQGHDTSDYLLFDSMIGYSAMGEDGEDVSEIFSMKSTYP